MQADKIKQRSSRVTYLHAGCDTFFLTSCRMVGNLTGLTKVLVGMFLGQRGWAPQLPAEQQMEP
jgi:hypothetical protein